MSVHDEVLAATLVAPYDLRVESYPFPQELEPGAGRTKQP